VKSKEQVLDSINSRKQIADARPHGRFIGVDPEPRPGRVGHMPGASCIPFGEILTKAKPEDNHSIFKSKDELTKAFKSKGIDPSQPVTTTCGSGVTASILALGLHLAGNRSYAVYDGAWAEWAILKEQEAPVVLGESDVKPIS